MAGGEYSSSITGLAFVWRLTRIIANGPAGLGRESWGFSLYHHNDDVWVDGWHTPYDMEESMGFGFAHPAASFDTTWQTGWSKENV